MFYVGDIFWLEKGEYICDIPNFDNYSGCIRYPSGSKFWYDKNLLQSFQDLVTGEWLPAISYSSGEKSWYDKGLRQSFQDPVTREWMPVTIDYYGRRKWHDKGALVIYPETYPWKERES